MYDLTIGKVPTYSKSGDNRLTVLLTKNHLTLWAKKLEKLLLELYESNISAK